MPRSGDYGSIVRSFQQGSNWAQDYRANKQLEKARDLALEQGTYDMESVRAGRKAVNPDVAAELGEGYAAENADWEGGLEDPFMIRLFKRFFGGEKQGSGKREAIPTGGITPVAPVAGVADEEPEMEGFAGAFADGGKVKRYADGGKVDEDDEERKREREREARYTEGTKRGGAALKTGAMEISSAGPRIAAKAIRAGADVMDIGTDDPVGNMVEMSVDAPRALAAGGMRRFADYLYNPNAGGSGGAAPAAAPAPTKAQAIVPSTKTDPNDPEVQRLLAGWGGGKAAPAAAAPRAAAPTKQTLDFSKMNIEARDVPDMKTDDWKKYRAQMIAAAQKSGKPEAVQKANDIVTDMQHKGFLNYAMQGLAHQQAGNDKAAMAAYRAAYQYFPNGYDVEFGTMPSGKGRVIVGFGRDEKTGKVEKGTELVMDPERVGVMIENFRNPAAFRMWTKDWRDFQQGQRKYEEVDKPLAQSTADYQVTMGQAALTRAENTGEGGGGDGLTDQRAAEAAFRKEFEMMALEDPEGAQHLEALAARIKMHTRARPDEILYQLMQAHKSGKLPELMAEFERRIQGD